MIWGIISVYQQGSHIHGGDRHDICGGEAGQCHSSTNHLHDMHLRNSSGILENRELVLTVLKYTVYAVYTACLV